MPVTPTIARCLFRCIGMRTLISSINPSILELLFLIALPFALLVIAVYYVYVYLCVNCLGVKWFERLRLSSLPDCVWQAARNLRFLATSRKSLISVRPRGIRLVPPVKTNMIDRMGLYTGIISAQI